MSHHMDYLIIGAGPAGLQLGFYLQQQGMNYLILEGSDKPGHFFEHQPRHRQLISINKKFTGYNDPEINLRWDWNSLLSDYQKAPMTEYTKDFFPNADYMLQYLQDYVDFYQLNIQYNKPVTMISKPDHFVVHTADGDCYEAPRLIVATGVSQPYVPSIPGIEHTVNYADMPVAKEPFEGKSVLVIGKGNSGFETADYLINAAKFIHIASPRPIKMAWRSHFVGDLRAVNNNLLDTYQLKSQHAVVNAHIKQIEKVGDRYRVTFAYTLASEEVETIDYDWVLTCTGFQFDHSIFDNRCQPKLDINDRFPAQTEHYESVNVKDLYFAGTIMQQRDYKHEQSAFIHGFRYNIYFLANYLLKRYNQQDWPQTVLPWDQRALADKIIKRINWTSGLWQQTGYLCDVAAFEPERNQITYVPCVSHEYVLQNPIHEAEHQLVITLQFGQQRINRAKYVFAIDRVHKHDTSKAHLSTGIHPILYHYHRGKLVSVQHLIEDFFSEWKEPEHYNPLLAYLSQIFETLPHSSQQSFTQSNADTIYSAS